jgi:hypothetical protein
VEIDAEHRGMVGRAIRSCDIFETDLNQRGCVMSNKKQQGLLTAGLLIALSLVGGVSAMDDAGKRYVDRMVKGGPDSLHEVAESMYQAGVTDPEVLDVAAEVLLEKYNRTAGSFGLNDAMAYLCKTLGASGNARYKPVVAKVADDAENHKLRSHCSKAGKGFPKKTDVAGYVAGTVDLEKLRNPPPPPPPPAAAPAKAATANGKAPATNTKGKQAAAAAPAVAAATPAAPAAKTVDFSKVHEGMSSQEVTELLGPPTGQSQHMTGKQFHPFNFGARDLQRMYFLYKGVGHIEFSLKSAYEGVYRVIAITPDANESGYP